MCAFGFLLSFESGVLPRACGASDGGNAPGRVFYVNGLHRKPVRCIGISRSVQGYARNAGTWIHVYMYVCLTILSLYSFRTPDPRWPTMLPSTLNLRPLTLNALRITVTPLLLRPHLNGTAKYQ